MCCVSVQLRFSPELNSSIAAYLQSHKPFTPSQTYAELGCDYTPGRKLTILLRL